MSGANVPYHMRQNKAVERMLFVDMLTKVNRQLPVGRYRYISFGGAFLEDFKLIHSHFGNDRMMSIEQSEAALKRQAFNLPLNCISALQMESGKFVDEFESNGESSIIWLDYTSPSELRTQIQEIQTLLPKLQVGDILKITLNANPSALRPGIYVIDGKRELAEITRKAQFDEFCKRLGDMLPKSISAEDMASAKFPNVLLRIMEFAINSAMEGRRLAEGVCFLPLAAFSYQDGQQMFTLSGVLVAETERETFLQETGIEIWEHSCTNWNNPRKIAVPALTPREKLTIDKLLPNSQTQEIQETLGFCLGEEEKESLEAIDNYKRYYRYYPNYQRVIF